MDKHERKSKNKIGIVLDEGYFYDELTVKEMKMLLLHPTLNGMKQFSKIILKSLT